MMRPILLMAALAAVSAVPVYALGPVEAPAKAPAKVAVCGACHGTNGVSKLPMYPNLAGQYDDYIVHVLHEYKDGQRKNPIMGPMAKTLSEKDVQELAAWFSTRPAKVYTPSVMKPFSPKVASNAKAP